MPKSSSESSSVREPGGESSSMAKYSPGQTRSQENGATTPYPGQMPTKHRARLAIAGNTAASRPSFQGLDWPAIMRTTAIRNSRQKKLRRARSLVTRQRAPSLARYEERMAKALASVINVLDPDVIVLGGGCSNIDRLYENVPQMWGPYAFSDEITTRLRHNAHGDSSGVRGAAWLWPLQGRVRHHMGYVTGTRDRHPSRSLDAISSRTREAPRSATSSNRLRNRHSPG